MARIANLILQLINDYGSSKTDIGGIGIGVPGVLDIERGVVLFLPNLPGTWPDVPLAETVESLSGLPVQLLNDVRSITYGEWRFGAGRGVDTVAVFAIGTGIGGGLIVNGQLHLGIGGTGGELGHTVIDYNGPRCGCGNYGCLEAYASGPAIAALGMKAVAQGLTTTIGELCEYDLNRITPELIARAAESGDEIAADIYEKAGFYLGVAASSICASIGPRRIILSGGVAQAGKLLLEPMERTMRARVHVMPVEQVQILIGQLGNNAGVVGVALWAASHIKQEY
jgi:glucokinase